METESLMVIASKYRLEVPLPGKNGAFDTNGQKVLLLEDKVVSRVYVEARNEHPNNEHWIINEAETALLPEKSKAKRKLLADKKRIANMDAGKVVGALVQQLSGGAVKAEDVDAPAVKAKKTTKKAEKLPPADDTKKEAGGTEDEVVKEPGNEVKADTGGTGSEEADPPVDEKTDGQATEESPKEKPIKRMNLTELRAKCEDNGYPYDSEATKAKLIEIITEKEEDKS